MVRKVFQSCINHGILSCGLKEKFLVKLKYLQRNTYKSEVLLNCNNIVQKLKVFTLKNFIHKIVVVFPKQKKLMYLHVFSNLSNRAVKTVATNAVTTQRPTEYCQLLIDINRSSLIVKFS